jgi:hypothetical protein
MARGRVLDGFDECDADDRADRDGQLSVGPHEPVIWDRRAGVHACGCCDPHPEVTATVTRAEIEKLNCVIARLRRGQSRPGEAGDSPLPLGA